MKPVLIDTHCHLDFDSFDEDRDVLVERSRDAGVIGIVVPALDLDNIPAILALTERYDGVYAAVGIHPNSSAGWQDDWLGKVRAAAGHPKVVAIGEIGLDYYWDKSPRSVQRRAFSAQLDLAADLDLPVIVHNRESTDDVLESLATSQLPGRAHAGVLHSFSGDWAAAQRALSLGFYLGFTGPVTFKKAGELREIAAQVPLDRLLIETDAPFLTPHPHRGQRNEPAYVRFVAEAIDAVRGLAPGEVAAQSTANAIRLFRLPLSATVLEDSPAD